MFKVDLSPVHPGEILLEEFLKPRIKPRKVTLRGLFLDSGLKIDICYVLVNGKCRVTRQIARLLARFLGTTVDLWLNLQQDYDSKMCSCDLGTQPWRRPSTKGLVKKLKAIGFHAMAVGTHVSNKGDWVYDVFTLKLSKRVPKEFDGIKVRCVLPLKSKAQRRRLRAAKAKAKVVERQTRES